MAEEWDEIKKLAADLQRAQLGGAVQKLSEANCIEIINCLVNSGQLKVIYTTDGKEYLTHKQLERELDDELYVAQGRISLSDLATNLNVDYSHVEYQAQQLAKHDSNVHLVLGQLINSKYLDDVADQLNEKLQVVGTLSISTLAKDYNLPSEFLSEEIIKRLGKFIEGFQDEHDPKVILTPAYISRYRARIRGVLTGISMPMPVSLIVKEFGFEGRMFFNLAEEMIRDNTIKGSITGGRQVGKATYVPANYAKAQNDWIENFFLQNGYLEYDALSRLGISDPKSTIKRKFVNDNITFLRSCCIGENVRNIAEIQIEEALASQVFVDIIPHLPSVISQEDVSSLLTEILSSGKYDNAQIFCETIVVSKIFVSDLYELFKPEVSDRSGKFIATGKYAAYLKTRSGNDKFDMSEMGEDKKSKDKEERRNKAAQGKAGGGAQGRETKTKSSKGKKGNKNKKAAFNDDSDDENVVAKKSPALEFMTLHDLSNKLGTVTTLTDAPEELNEELASFIQPTLNKSYEESLNSLYQTKMTSSMQSKRRNFQDFQDKIIVMVETIRLFEKGVECFDDEKVKSNFQKYLLKTLGHELVNESVLYACQENDVSSDKQEINVDQRNKLIGQLPKDVAQPLASLSKKCLENSQDFLDSLEDNIASSVNVTLKKSDRKKDRQTVFNHRQKLMQEVESCQDPAMTLHLVSLVLFQFQTGCMLHASGKFVPNVIAKVCENLDEENKNILTTYQNLVVSLMGTKDPDEKGAIQKELEMSLRAVKDVVLNPKKPTPP